jgi:hypothetical protein
VRWEVSEARRCAEGVKKGVRRLRPGTRGGGEAGFPGMWASTELHEMAGRLGGRDDRRVPLSSESEEAHAGEDAPTRRAQLTARARGKGERRVCSWARWAERPGKGDSWVVFLFLLIRISSVFSILFSLGFSIQI